MVDFGYDVADYTDVDPLVGDLGTSDRLVAEAHARDIRVIVDWGAEPFLRPSPLVHGIAPLARRPAPRLVRLAGRPTRGAPTDRVGIDLRRPGVDARRATGQWYLHAFAPEQPDLN